MNYDELDPGIREMVRKVREAGFDTSDSGDGVSKPADWYESGCAMPFPNIAVAPTPTSTMVEDAERMAVVLGDGWVVEASYSTRGKSALLLARTLDEREK